MSEERQNDKPVKLKKITFTGIDRKTNIDELAALFRDYPKVEFGFLAHENYNSLGNQCCSPSMLYKYKDIKLPLSLHVCGKRAKRILQTGDWNDLITFMQGTLSLFSRIQLNIGGVGVSDSKWKLSAPEGISEIILQQRSADYMPIYEQYLDNQANIDENFTVLFDASGGKGIYQDEFLTASLPYAGYAGGLGPGNVMDAVHKLESDGNVQNYWIDMQAKVRDGDDWFSVELCRKVCEALEDFAL